MGLGSSDAAGSSLPVSSAPSGFLCLLEGLPGATGTALALETSGATVAASFVGS